MDGHIRIGTRVVTLAYAISPDSIFGYVAIGLMGLSIAEIGRVPMNHLHSLVQMLSVKDGMQGVPSSLKMVLGAIVRVFIPAVK